MNIYMDIIKGLLHRKILLQPSKEPLFTNSFSNHTSDLTEVYITWKNKRKRVFCKIMQFSVL